MLTRREEDMAIVGIEAKNTELLLKWAEGKEGNRYGNRQGQGPPQGTEGAEASDGNFSTGRGANRVEGTEGAVPQEEGVY